MTRFRPSAGRCSPTARWTQKTKQLIAVAVAHVTQCPYCIQGHTRAALRKGADESELMEAIWVAAEMRAGGAYAHSVLALDTAAHIHPDGSHGRVTQARPKHERSGLLGGRDEGHPPGSAPASNTPMITDAPGRPATASRSGSSAVPGDARSG